MVPRASELNPGLGGSTTGGREPPWPGCIGAGGSDQRSRGCGVSAIDCNMARCCKLRGGERRLPDSHISLSLKVCGDREPNKHCLELGRTGSPGFGSRGSIITTPPARPFGDSCQRRQGMARVAVFPPVGPAFQGRADGFDGGEQWRIDHAGDRSWAAVTGVDQLDRLTGRRHAVPSKTKRVFAGCGVPSGGVAQVVEVRKLGHAQR